VPRKEVEAKQAIMNRFGFDPSLIFESQDDTYLQFKKIEDKQSMLELIEEADVVQSKMAALQ
jgi:hypothetical protein